MPRNNPRAFSLPVQGTLPRSQDQSVASRTLDFLPEISLKYTIVINSDAMVGVRGLPRFSPNRCDLLDVAKPFEALDERRV
jgi:hypothetical protein